MKNGKILKMAIGLCLISLLALPLLAGCSSGTTTIGISQVVTHPALDATRQGIIDALADNGYAASDDFVISQAAIAAAEGTDIPVVFTAVTDPVGSGMVSSWESHENENVTGVSDMIVVSDDVELITRIMPGVKKLGTMYNAGESNSVFLAEKLNEASEALGIEVVEVTVSTRNRASCCLASLDASISG